MHGTCAISYKTQKINQIFISEKFQEKKSPDSAPFPTSQPVSQLTTDKFCEPRAAGSWNNYHKTYQVCDLIKNIVNIHACFFPGRAFRPEPTRYVPEYSRASLAFSGHHVAFKTQRTIYNFISNHFWAGQFSVCFLPYAPCGPLSGNNAPDVCYFLQNTKNKSNFHFRKISRRKEPGLRSVPGQPASQPANNR